MNIITGDTVQGGAVTMNVEYREEPPQLLIIVDEPHPLEERLKALSDDNDKSGIMGMFVGLYESGRQKEIEYLLSRHLFNEKETTNAVENIAKAVLTYKPDTEQD